MKSFIIGIAGEKNSGKDTVASMINYIVAVGVAKADYHSYIGKKSTYDTTFADRIIHFADPLKDCLSIIYNISREYFEDRTKKDDEWYCITERRFITEKDCTHNYYRIVIEDISSTSNDLNSVIEATNRYNNNYPNNKKELVIKLRTLMQYFGTEVVRNNMGKNTWINSVMGKAANIAETRRICIIPDVRFINERNAILGSFLYGVDVEIKRDNPNNTKHDSETIDFKCTNIIENNGTKMQLFYKVLELVRKTIK